MKHLTGLIVFSMSVAAVFTTSLQAQDEGRLRRAFEGKRVTILLDLPASSEGIDVFPGTGRPLDFDKYSGRIKKYSAALKEGDRSIITKVKVKDELIEIHLGGGGYGTFGDQFGALLTTNGADSGTAQQARIANERTQRQSAGSRINLRYPNGVTPEDLEADRLVQVLAECVTVAGVAGGPVASASAKSTETPAPTSAYLDPPPASEPKKGMSAEEVERTWGKATATRENGSIETRTHAGQAGTTFEVDFFNGVAVDVRKRAAGASAPTLKKGLTVAEVEALAGRALESKVNGSVTTNKYKWQDGTLEADFFNGVLVGYRISSN